MKALNSSPSTTNKRKKKEKKIALGRKASGHTYIQNIRPKGRR
jgi:hypothetical protein